jgi:ABC-type sugar transport system permease subunit
MDRRDLLFVAGMLASLFVSIFLPIISAFVLSGKQWRAAQDRERARRIAEYRLNARLLRLNI